MNMVRVEDVKVLETKLHELCELHPEMNEKQFASLKESLNLNGQQQPVVLYRGRVVDGRHRMKALGQLGVDMASAMELPRDKTISEVSAFVKTSETRRHQTKTQLACHAYLSLINPNSEIKSASQAALEYGVAKRDVSYCSSIAKHIGTSALEAFSKGETINLCVNGIYSNYSSVRRLYDAINREKKEQLVKKQLKNISFNLNEERAKIRNFCMNDSVELIGTKIQLMQEYLNDRFDQ